MRSRTSGSRWKLVVMIVSLAVFGGSPAAGQQDLTASIIGQVTDQSGAVLPGVTVTTTSPALQRQVTSVTNERGEYRLAPLPVGLYEVTFDLVGFRPAQRQEVRLTVGFVAKVDVALGLASVAETVTVSGASPLVDVSATSGNTLLTREMLELTATSRNSVMSVLTLAPGVRSFLDVGGGQMMLENPAARAYGVGGMTAYTIDGVNNFRLGSTFWDYQTFDEVRVQTTGVDADRPTKGVQVTAVVKSGGNEFHGSGFFAGSMGNLQADNLDQELRDIGITSGDALDNQYDVSGELGGRLIRNKLWFYSAARKRHAAYDVLNSFQPDGSPGQTLNDQRIITNKISYQANPANRFIFMNMWEHGDEQKGLNEFIAYESREFKTNDRPHTKIQWEGVRGNTFIASLQLGHSRQDGGSPFLNDPQLVGRSDLETERVTGDNLVFGETSYARAYHTIGSVSWYKPNWAHGNHEFKGGFDYGDVQNSYPGMGVKDINYHLQYSDGVADRVAFFNSPVPPRRDLNLFGAYFKDNWTIGRRLTLNLGLRYGHEAAGTPATCRETATGPSAPIFPAGCFNEVRLPTFDFVVPRLYASYDLSGDGKTVVKGGWGRFGNARGIADVTRYDPNAIAYAVFHWRDLNGNNDWNENETNRDPNGPDFIETVAHEFGAAPPRFVPNPDETQVMFDEYSANLERELMANFSIRVTGIYSKTNNVKGNLNPYRPYEAYNIPITNRDPGPDGTRGTADDGGLVTYYEYSPSLQSREFEAYTPITYPGRAADQTYKTIEVASVKRLANRWQLVASYSATKKHRPIGAVGLASSSGFGTASPTFSPDGTEALYVTPNNEINTTDNNWEWDGKVSGTYIFPAEVLVSASFHHESGDPFARQVRFTGGKTIPSIILNVDAIGSYRRPNLNVTTLKVEKRFVLPRSQAATVTFSVYNLLNANTATGLQNRSGPEFLRPRAIMPPRLGEFSVAYRF